MKMLRVCSVLWVPLAFAASASAANILFLGDLDGDALGDGSVAANAAADAAMIAHLGALGHTVTALDDLASTPADLAGKNLVLISATVGSSNVLAGIGGAAANLNGVALPIMNMEPGLFDAELGMNLSAFQGQYNGAALNITNNTSPITLGIPLGVQTVFTSAVEQVWVHLAVTIGPYGPDPAPGALTYAINDGYLGSFGVPNSSGCIVEVPSGGLLRGNVPAPALRLGFFVGRGSFDDLTPVGLQMFDNAVGYAIPEPASFSLILLAFGGLLLRKGR
jgi:hypothetical protein